MFNSLIIGLTGENRSGKGEFANFMMESYPRGMITKRGATEFLNEKLARSEKVRSRENYNWAVQDMEKTEGPFSLAMKIHQSILEAPEPIIIFDAVRMFSDFHLLRHYPKQVLVYVTADAQIRWQRAVKAAEKAGEGDVKILDFLAIDQWYTNRNVPAIGKDAEFPILNNGALLQFKTEIETTRKKIEKKFDIKIAA